MTRAGFVGLAGRPNVGKSTIANAIVGSKVAIVSDRPQTTRRAIRGIATEPGGDWQMILVDLPGVQRPRDSLTARMQRRVEQELADSAAALAAAAELDAVEEVFPVSARTGAGLEALVDHLVSLLPEGPVLYPPEERSDLPSEIHLAELIREQVLRRTRDEVPHAVEVAVESIEPRDDGLVEVRAQVWVESDSQKGILVGKGGRMVREVGTAARKELERELGAHVFLDLQVKVRRWRRDEGLLDRIGIE
jgi:GTP-binding protein Era